MLLFGAPKCLKQSIAFAQHENVNGFSFRGSFKDILRLSVGKPIRNLTLVSVQFDFKFINHGILLEIHSIMHLLSVAFGCAH